MKALCIVCAAPTVVHERAAEVVARMDRLLVQGGAPPLGRSEVVTCKSECYRAWRELSRAEQEDRTSAARRADEEGTEDADR